MSGSEPATVLVVDDERDVADAYAAQLSAEYDVSTAYSGQEAVDALQPGIDVILLDRRMPGISGDEVLAEVRERGLDIRVAMVTAVDPDFDIIEMPFDDYIIKPVSREDLFSTIDRLLETAEYESRLQEYYALSAKRGTLTANKSQAELEASEEYQELEARMEELQTELDDMITGFDDDDFTAAFRELDRPDGAG